jgi:hypothetical protein
MKSGFGKNGKSVTQESISHRRVGPTNINPFRQVEVLRQMESTVPLEKKHFGCSLELSFAHFRAKFGHYWTCAVIPRKPVLRILALFPVFPRATLNGRIPYFILKTVGRNDTTSEDMPCIGNLP